MKGDNNDINIRCDAMQDPKSNDSRRKLLKIIAAGGGAVVAGKSLPENWARPVVDSVMLPAHAQTSTLCSIPAGCYVFESDPGSISFPGGTEGSTISPVSYFSTVDDCSGPSLDVIGPIAVATTAQDAAVILGIAVGRVLGLNLASLPASGCRMWIENN